MSKRPRVYYNSHLHDPSKEITARQKRQIEKSRERKLVAGGEHCLDNLLPTVEQPWISDESDDSADSNDVSDSETNSSYSETEPEDLENGDCDSDPAKLGHERLDAPLFEGSPMSLGEYIQIQLTFARRHNLSRQATIGLFQKDALVLPIDNRDFPDSWFKLTKLLNGYLSNYCVHYICPEHQCYLGFPAMDENELQCPTDHKMIFVKDECVKKLFYFTTISVAETLRVFLKANYRKVKFDFQPNSEGEILDLSDGLMYRCHKENYGAGCRSISLSIHLDNVAPHKGKSANKKTCYVGQFTINEMTSADRQRHVFPFLIYCGRSMPPRETLLAPFIAEMNQLMIHGLDCEIQGNPALIKVFPILFPCDTVERNRLMEIKGHTGYYSCTTCCQKGSHAGTHIFEYTNDLPLRRHEEHMKLARKAANYNKNEKKKMEDQLLGVRGMSVLCALSLPVANFPRSFPSDFLHLICEGIFKTMLEYWITNNFLDIQASDWSLSLCRPHLCVKRLVRSIAEYHTQFNGGELMFLLLFFGPVAFNGNLTLNLYVHYLKLVRLCHFLLSDNLRSQLLPALDLEVHNFIRDFQSIYGKEKWDPTYISCCTLLARLKTGVQLITIGHSSSRETLDPSRNVSMAVNT